MNDKPLLRKITIPLFFVLFIVGAIEILTYFYFIYRPANAILGKENSLRLEIPAISHLIAPPQTTDESVSLADSPKTFRPENLASFRQLVDKKLSAQNSFVKSSRMDVIVAGEILEIKNPGSGRVGIDITNSTGNKISEEFSAAEAESIVVSIITFSLENPQRVEATLNALQKGDYIIIKTSTNLLDKNPIIKREVEIFRNPKSS